MEDVDDVDDVDVDAEREAEDTGGTAPWEEDDAVICGTTLELVDEVVDEGELILFRPWLIFEREDVDCA